MATEYDEKNVTTIILQQQWQENVKQNNEFVEDYENKSINIHLAKILLPLTKKKIYDSENLYKLCLETKMHHEVEQLYLSKRNLQKFYAKLIAIISSNKFESKNISPADLQLSSNMENEYLPEENYHLKNQKFCKTLSLIYPNNQPQIRAVFQRNHYSTLLPNLSLPPTAFETESLEFQNPLPSSTFQVKKIKTINYMI
jgi:hypothetical protein